MSALSDKDIGKALKEGRLKIQPFQDEFLQPASYDLRVRRVLAPGRGILNPSEVTVMLRTGEWAEVESLEWLELPTDAMATFGLRSSIARRGIIAFGGPQVDPGYRGRLYVGLFNPSSETLSISAEEPLLTIQFFSLSTPASRPYGGQYNNLPGFPEEDVIRMTRMNTPTLADVVQSVGILERTVTELTSSVKGLRIEMSWVRNILLAILGATIVALFR